MHPIVIPLAIAAGLLATPLDSNAQGGPPISQVEVVNEPLAVEVTNPPAANALPRFQLVGFTSATFMGGEGVFGYTRECQAEFGDENRICLSDRLRS